MAKSQSACPSYERGKSAIARANGCTHDCTDGKNAARNALREMVDPECYRHITSTRPCEKIDC